MLAPRKRSCSPPSGASEHAGRSSGSVIVGCTLLCGCRRSCPRLAWQMREPIPYDWLVDAQAIDDRPGSGRPARRVGCRPATGRCHDGSRTGCATSSTPACCPAVGACPPSARSPRLAVSRTTVTQALDELRGEGRLRSRQGSGTYVAGPAAPLPFGTRVAEHLSSGPGSIWPRATLPTCPTCRRCRSRCGSSTRPAAARRSTPPGSRRCARRSPSCTRAAGRPGGRGRTDRRADPRHRRQPPGELTFCSPRWPRRGSTVAVAEYSYPGIFDIFDSCDVRPVAGPPGPGGMVPESLDHVLTRDRPAVLYFQAGPQIPTGQVTTASRIRALARCSTAIEPRWSRTRPWPRWRSMASRRCSPTTAVWRRLCQPAR